MTQNKDRNYTTYKKLFNIKFDIKKNFNINKINIPIFPLAGERNVYFPAN